MSLSTHHPILRTGLCLLVWLLAGRLTLAVELAPVPAKLVVRSCDETSPTLTYAVEKVVAELGTVHGRQPAGEAGAKDVFKASRNTGVVVLGRPDRSPALAKWCRDHGVNTTVLASMPDGYHVVVLEKPWRVVIAAQSDIGAWYGACAWLDSLRNNPDGAVQTPLGEIRGAPALAIRHSRGLGGNDHLSQPEQAIPSLDWWARWRMNVAHAPNLPEPALKTFLAEAHKRGIRVVRGIGVRNLCAADDRAVAKCAEEFRQFLKLGGDGVSALWDDLSHDRCSGHCDACRRRFGTNSLPSEILVVLEALCDVAAQTSTRPLILWCPPHYSENRYKELPDKTFFDVIGGSQKVRQQTAMYYCEFGREKTTLLDQAGITNRVWWYNGLRTVYHVSHHWPTTPEMKLDIPGLKTFDVPDFARFEVGWKTGIGVGKDGTVLPPPENVWQDFRTLPLRYQGYYPCTAGHPYHAAVSGLFAFNPAEFQQAEADRIVFRAIFGPGCAQTARAWSDAYMQFQVWLAQCTGSPFEQPQMSEAQKRLAQWRRYSVDVRACAATNRSLLVPGMLSLALKRMAEAEDSAERIANRLSHPAEHAANENAAPSGKPLNKP